MPDDASLVAASAAREFDVLQCEECAHNIKAALILAGYSGQVVEIRDAGGHDFMICFSYDGGQATITQNGKHVGVRVGEMVFDNLHPDGLMFDQWLKDFDGLGGVAVYSTTAF